MGGARLRASFVGRGPELDRLDAALARITRGVGLAFLCGGEAGIGKTRLVSEFTGRAEADGCAILVGGCVELGSAGLPYGPFAEALRTAVGAATLQPETLAGPVVEQLALLVPDLTTHADSAADQAELGGLGQVRLFEAVLAAIQRIGAERPVVLVVEDLHWADRATQDLLSFLVRNVESAGFLIVATVRTDAVPRDAPLATTLGELSRRASVERIDLGPLDLAGTAEHLRVILGEEPEPRLLQRIHLRSDGNPFYIEQLAWAHLDGEDTALPPSLRDILLAQLSRQPSEVQAVLSAAAVAGSHVDEGLLSAMLGRDEDEVLVPLREALRAHLLVPRDVDPRGYGFRHALMAEAAESDLLEADRRRLHARCADALERRLSRDGAEHAQRTARIAYHRDRAGDVQGTIGGSIRAALAAEAASAHGDALVRYRRALELIDAYGSPEPHPGWDVAEAFHRAAVCAAVAGEAKEAARLIRAAVERLPADADPHRRGRLLVDLSEYLWLAGEPDFIDSLTLAAEVIPAEPPTPERVNALISLGYHHQFNGRLDDGWRSFDEARRTAIAGDLPRDEAMARTGLASIQLTRGDVAGGGAEILASLAAIRRAPLAANVSIVYLDLSATAGWAAYDELAVAITREGIALAQEHGFATYYGAAMAANGAECLLSLGRLDEAWLLLDATEVNAVGGWSDTSRLITRAAVATAMGRLDQARDDLAASSSWADTGDRSVGRWRAVQLAEFLVTDQRPAEVGAAVQAGLALPPTHVPWHDQRACLHWSDIRAAADLAQRAAAQRDRPASAAAQSAVAAGLDHLEKLVGDGASAQSPIHRRARAYQVLALAEASRAAGASDPSLWQAAARSWSGVNWVLRPLYARIREAEARFEGGREGRADAIEILRAAHAEADARGAGPLRALAAGLAMRARVDLTHEEVTSAIRAVGPGSAASGPAHAYALTAREVEILALLTTGLTNRQIAERLFISPKTAGVHVSNILGKLGVGSRVQAATVAHRMGMGDPLSGRAARS